MHQSETEVSDRSPSKQPFQKRVGNLFIAQSYSNFSWTAVFHHSFSWCDFNVTHWKEMLLWTNFNNYPILLQLSLLVVLRL